MPDLRDRLDRRAAGYEPPADLFDRVLDRGRRRERNRRAGIAVVALATAAVVIGGLVRAFTAEQAPVPADQPSPAAREVLNFSGDPVREVPGDLVVVNPATGEERVLVEELEAVYAARWSADGRWVAYETAGPNGSGLWVVTASQEPRLVASDPSAWAWSARGARLVTIRRAPEMIDYNGATVSTIDPVTGETTDVGSIPDDLGDVTSMPAWSPNGTRFVFGVRGGGLYSLAAASGAVSLLVQLPGENLDSVDGIYWSPDGTHLAVLNDFGGGGLGLYLMDADGSDVRVLSEHASLVVGDWAPDGTRFAFVDESEPDGTVRLASTDGSAPTELGRRPNPTCEALFCLETLTWSPDGSRIALQTAGDGSVMTSTIDVDGNDTGPIDDLTYRSWDGGSYSCRCPA